MEQLAVQGKKIDIKLVKSELTMSKFMNVPGFRRVFCITPPHGMRESTVKIEIVKRKMKKSKKNKRKYQRKREERLQELLSTTVEVKRPTNRARPKYPLPLTTKLYPDFKIQSQIHRTRKMSLEQLRQIFYKRNEDKDNKEDMFDLSVLLPFITTAYHRLYEQDLELLHQLVEEEQPLIVKGEKPTLRIKDEYVERIIYSDEEDNDVTEVEEGEQGCTDHN